MMNGATLTTFFARRSHTELKAFLEGPRSDQRTLQSINPLPPIDNQPLKSEWQTAAFAAAVLLTGYDGPLATDW